jgi:translocation and assembly module TamB
VSGLAYDDVRLTEAELTVNGARGREQWLRRMELNGTLGYVSLPSLSVEQTNVQATYDGTSIDLSSQVRLDPTHAADVEATVTPGASQTNATFTRLDLRLDGNRWSLLKDATVSIGDRYHIRGLLLRSGDQQISANGTVDVNGQQSLIVTAEAVEVGSIAPLVGFEGVAGTLDGSLNLTGPATAPELESQLAFDLQTRNREVGTLRFAAQYQDLSLGFNTTLVHQNGRTLRATGTLPIDLRLQAPGPAGVADRPVQIDVATDQFPVDWVDPFLDPTTVRGVEGLLTASVAVRGRLNDPTLEGTASLSGGAAFLPALDVRYFDAQATLRFADDRVTLQDATLRSTNDGRLRAEGVINFPQLTVGEYDLQVRADDFLAIDTRAYRRAIVNGALTLRGTIQQPVLGGTVRLRSADIYYNEALAESGSAAAAVQLSEEDQLTLENRFGIRLTAADTTTFDAYEALEMDLTVEIQRNTWLRSESNPELNVQFTGDLDVTKARDAEPQIFGSIQVVSERSTLRQFGQEFQITEGTLTFNGDPYTPYLNLAAVYEQRAQGAQGTEVRITLTLEGRPEKLSPSLSSDPPMDTRNILSYLATGRPADELLSGGDEGSGGGGSLATQVALGQATNFVENLAASELGLDVVRVQLRPSGASYLTVGRYFTPRLFVSIQQPVTTSSPTGFQTTQYLPDLTVEYQLLDTLLLRALNNQQSFQLNLLFEYAY